MSPQTAIIAVVSCNNVICLGQSVKNKLAMLISVLLFCLLICGSVHYICFFNPLENTERIYLKKHNSEQIVRELDKVS